jgi:IS30 family transposase
MNTKTTKEQWEQAKKWRDEGVSNLEVAKRLNVTPGRVSQKIGRKRLKEYIASKAAE